MITKWKCDLKKKKTKQDLQCCKHPRITEVKFVGPSP